MWSWGNPAVGRQADGDSPLRAGVIDGLMLHFSGVKWRAVIPIF